MSGKYAGKKVPILRLLALGFGITLLLWLPVEDTSPFITIIFAACLDLAFSLRLGRRWRGNPWPGIPLLGLLAGLAITPTTILLMAFKTGLHGHGFPEYTPAQVSGVLAATPLFVFAGLLVSLGVTIFLTKSSRNERDTL